MSNLDYGTDPSRELAQWLQEAARRRYPVPAPRRHARPPPEPPKKWRTARDAIAFGALAAAYFQYYMLGVMLEIASMKTVTVFV